MTILSLAQPCPLVHAATSSSGRETGRRARGGCAVEKPQATEHKRDAEDDGERHQRRPRGVGAVGAPAGGLVAVPARVGAQLTPRAVVALGAVAVARIARVGAAAASGPVAKGGAFVRRGRRRREAPAALVQAERLDGRVRAAADPRNGAARRALGHRRVCVRPKVAVGAQGALGGRLRRVLASLAGQAHGRARLWLVRSGGARLALGLALGGLMEAGSALGRRRRARERRVRAPWAREAVEEAGAANVGVVAAGSW